MITQIALKPATAEGDKLAASEIPLGFLSAEQLLQRLPVCRATLRTWTKEGKIPVIRLTGRRILYDWGSVSSALLRHQRGGAQ
jgi:hypothetical protein